LNEADATTLGLTTLIDHDTARGVVPTVARVRAATPIRATEQCRPAMDVPREIDDGTYKVPKIVLLDWQAACDRYEARKQRGK
jgi:hypothetical protein